MASRGFPVFPVAICPPPCPVSREVSKTRSPAAKALGGVEKGFFPGLRGKQWSPTPALGVGVLALQQNDSERG